MNNEMLVGEINLCRKIKTMSNGLAKMFMTLVNEYRGGTFRKSDGYEDMKAHALLTLTRTWYNFEPAEGDNMVAIFNRVIHSAFVEWESNALKEEKLSQQLQDLTPDE